MSNSRKQGLDNHPLLTHFAEVKSTVKPLLQHVCNEDLKNGIHTIALVDWQGNKHTDDENGCWTIGQRPNRENAYKVIISLFKKQLESYFHLLKPKSSISIPSELSTLLKPVGARFTVGNHHIFFTNLDLDAHFFILAISWEGIDYGPTTFVGPFNSAISCRNDIAKALNTKFPDWYPAENLRVVD